MSLSEFFAKQNKKKTKKKQNPAELMNMLTKERENIKSLPETSVPQDNKPAIAEKEDEWEIIDDEKEIDLQNIRISKLTSTTTEDSNKQSAKNKESREGDGDAVVEKKVWAAKVAEAPEEPAEPIVQPPPKPSVYIPAPLRQGGSAFGVSAAKPNVASTMDFPSLDAVVSEPQKKETQPETNKDDDGDSWQQAGVRRPNPVASVPPVAINTTPSAYVPPCLRQAANQGIVNIGSSHSQITSAPRNDPPSRFDCDSGFKRSVPEASGFREVFSSGGGWARGEVISGGSGNSSTVKQTPNPPNVNSQTSSENTNGWSRNVNVKTYKDSAREKPGLEIDLRNRFTAFSSET
ncbi:unnamed protein product [Trichobilharzia szidati]|nr:unnamed protein product [Trichobilharzia szidati]